MGFQKMPGPTTFTNSFKDGVKSQNYKFLPNTKETSSQESSNLPLYNKQKAAWQIQANTLCIKTGLNSN